MFNELYLGPPRSLYRIFVENNISKFSCPTTKNINKITLFNIFLKVCVWAMNKKVVCVPPMLNGHWFPWWFHQTQWLYLNRKIFLIKFEHLFISHHTCWELGNIIFKIRLPVKVSNRLIVNTLNWWTYRFSTLKFLF